MSKIENWGKMKIDKWVKKIGKNWKLGKIENWGKMNHGKNWNWNSGKIENKKKLKI